MREAVRGVIENMQKCVQLLLSELVIPKNRVKVRDRVHLAIVTNMIPIAKF